MEPIIVKVCIVHSAQIEREFLGFTNYEIVGQGDFHSVKNSAISVVVNYLDVYSRRGQKLPLPKPNFPVDDFMLEERVERRYERLSPLIFEFYRRPQN